MFYPLKLVREKVKVNTDNKPMEEIEPSFPTIEIPKLKNKKFTKT